MTELGDRLPPILITLLKGVIYREEDLTRWQNLLELQGPVQDYFSVIGLNLTLHEDEGFAFLKNSERSEEDSDLPQLISRRRLSYTVSLLLAQLRRCLAEHDASSGEERLILDREEVIQIMGTFLKTGSNEVKFSRKIEAALQKISDFGFIRFMGDRKEKIEVRRIIKAFIDAQWLNEFDQHLKEYNDFAGEDGDEQEDSDE